LTTFPPPKRPSGLWHWYTSRTRSVQLAIGCGAALAVLLFFACIGASAASVHLATPTLTPTPTPTSTILTNLIKNGSFENTGNTWLLPWFFQVKSGAAGEIAQRNQDKVDGHYSARVDISQANSNDWDVQLGQNLLPITAGRTYTISFSAMAPVNRQLRVAVQQASSPWTAYFVQTASLPNPWHWQQFSFTFTPTVSNSNPMLVFNLASQKGSVWIDKVSMQ
jgi:endoglucanase